MKIYVAGWVALMVWASAAAQAPAQAPAPAPTPTDAKKAGSATATKAVPAAPVKKDTKKKKADEMGTIAGMEIPRGTGFLGLQIVNGVFKLTSYDGKKKPAAADFSRVVMRWNVQYQKNPERALLLPSTGVGVFSTEKIVKPPHAFRLTIILLKGENDDAPGETFTVDFRG
jgi:hypothetical protein